MCKRTLDITIFPEYLNLEGQIDRLCIRCLIYSDYTSNSAEIVEDQKIRITCEDCNGPYEYTDGGTFSCSRCLDIKIDELEREMETNMTCLNCERTCVDDIWCERCNHYFNTDSMDSVADIEDFDLEEQLNV